MYENLKCDEYLCCLFFVTSTISEKVFFLISFLFFSQGVTEMWHYYQVNYYPFLDLVVHEAKYSSFYYYFTFHFIFLLFFCFYLKKRKRSMIMLCLRFWRISVFLFLLFREFCNLMEWWFSHNNACCLK